MIAFVTLLKRSAADPLSLVIVLSAVLLSACFRLPGAGDDRQAQEPPPPPAQKPRPPEPLESTGLTPLPTADQLLASMPIGRADPFAPEPRAELADDAGPATLAGGRAAGPSSGPAAPGRSGTASSASSRLRGGRRPAPLPPLQLPADFRFNGVMRAGSRPQALVQLGGDIGTVCIGARGFCAGSGLAALLPPGWTVAAIDVERGRLTLRQGQRSVTAEL